MKYRVTEQEASVVERSYDVEAETEEQAQEALEEMMAPEKDGCFVHEETVQMNVEITNVEPAS